VAISLSGVSLGVFCCSVLVLLAILCRCDAACELSLIVDVVSILYDD